MFGRHHRISGIAVAVALAAVAPSVASARVDLTPPTATDHTQAASSNRPRAPSPRDTPRAAGHAVEGPGAQVAREPTTRDAAIGGGTVTSAPARMVKVSQPDGFAWADAVVGAGALFGLILVLLGSTLFVARRHTARVR